MPNPNLIEAFNPNRPQWWNAIVMSRLLFAGFLAAYLTGSAILSVLIAGGVVAATVILEGRIWAGFYAWWDNLPPVE